MQMTIWYPAEPGTGTPVTFAANPVYTGHDALQDAEVSSSGRHPVVLLSHGLGGLAYSAGWLAQGLAQNGAVVIAPNHPNSSFFDFDMQAGMNHWTRTQDMQAALQALELDAEFGAALDLGRIYAAGFSYGGWTALSLGGLRGHAEGFRDYCAQAMRVSSHCQDLLRAGVDLTAVDAGLWEASYRDARIQAVAAIDPGLIHGIPQDMAADLAAPALLIGLGGGSDRLPATDFDASGFAGLVPAAKVLRIAPASHFTALPPCTPQGPEILTAEGDDPVCTDPEGTDRAEVHRQMIDAIARHFSLPAAADAGGS
jgi:predicted dienelactone hydrolase